MLKKCIKYFCFIVVMFATVVSGINAFSNISKNIECDKEIKSESISASEKKSMKYTKRNVRVIYTYVYNEKIYVGEQYTTKDVLNKAIEDNELIVYVSDENPEISIIDKKEDIIFFDISEFICGLIILGYITYKKLFKKQV